MKLIAGFVRGVVVTSALGLAGAAQAETVNFMSELNNPEPNDDDNFGYASALDNGVAVVGAWRNDDPSADVGIAYVYDATTGALLHTLRNPTPQSSDRFGRSVAVSGDYALIGAYGDDIGGNGSGAAHLFDLTTGALVHSFTNPTPAATDRFGWSVALSDGQAMIGAWLDDAGATDSGAAYIFDLAGDLSTPTATLTNPTPEFDERFGSSVALSGTVAMAAAQYANDLAGRAGEVYLFDSLTGDLLRTLANPVGTAGEQFGAGIDIEGNLALVGAPNADPNGANTGAAYLFDVLTGELLRTFLSPEPDVLAGFGSNVSLDGDHALVSAWKSDASGTDSGAAYLYSLLTGDLIRILPARTGAGGQFGASISMNDGLLLIGAAEDGVGGGAAYVFSLSADVPLPPAAALLGLGVLCLGALRRRA